MTFCHEVLCYFFVSFSLIEGKASMLRFKGEAKAHQLINKFRSMKTKKYYTIWKNKKKKKDKHPDYFVVDWAHRHVGSAYNNKTKNGEEYIRVSIERETRQ